MNCCGRVRLTSDDRKALSILKRYEIATETSHTCLADLTPNHIDDVGTWLATHRSKAYRQKALIQLRTAARRQGAEIPSRIMRVDVEGLVDPIYLDQMPTKERTACRHFALYCQHMGIRIKLSAVNAETVGSFRTYLDQQGSIGKGQRDHIISHLRKAIRRAGGDLGSEKMAFIGILGSTADYDLYLIEIKRWVEPYAEYLRERWKSSTLRGSVSSYERFASKYIARILRHQNTTRIDLRDIFRADYFRLWKAEVNGKNDWLIRRRAVTGFINFWANEIGKCHIVDELLAELRESKPKKFSQRSRSNQRCEESSLWGLADEYIAMFRQANRSSERPKTILRRFLGWCGRKTPPVKGPNALTEAVLDDYISDLLNSYENWETAQRYISDIGSFWRWLYHRGQLPSFSPSVIPRSKSNYSIRPWYLTEKQVVAFLQAIMTADDQAETYQKRDLAMMVLGLTTGCRGVEVRNLKLDDFCLDRMWVRYYCEKNERVLPLPEIAASRLEEYLRVRPRADLRSINYVFLGGNGAFGRRLSKRGLIDIFHRYRERAGIPKRLGAYHCLRRTFAMRLADMNTDAATMMALLGHNSLSATNAYLKIHPSAHALVVPEFRQNDLEVVMNV